MSPRRLGLTITKHKTYCTMRFDCWFCSLSPCFLLIGPEKIKISENLVRKNSLGTQRNWATRWLTQISDVHSGCMRGSCGERQPTLRTDAMRGSEDCRSGHAA